MGFFEPSSWAPKTDAGRAASTLPKCGACGLFKTCHSLKMEPATGKRPILIVGEFPDGPTDKAGKHLAGPAGNELRSIAFKAGLNIDDCYVTNSIICHPPHNAIKADHIEYCRPNLLNTIKRLKPAVIILLGISAVQSLIGTEWGGEIGSITKWAGHTFPSSKYGAWICPTFDPSYVLQTESDPVLVRMVRDHLEAAKRLEKRPPASQSLADLSAKVEIITDPRQAKLRMTELSTRRGRLAFDYETTGLKPERPEQRIVSASFCFEGEDTFACMIDTDYHREELCRVLDNERLLKIASNLKFENRWSIAKLGRGVKGWHYDTMLGAHIIDNRSGITSVKFQTYKYLGIGDYALWVDTYLKTAKYGNDLNDIHKIHPHDLLMYNSLDSLVEFMVMEKQLEVLPWVSPPIPK